MENKELIREKLEKAMKNIHKMNKKELDELEEYLKKLPEPVPIKIYFSGYKKT
ncbi:protein of unknown function [endosymbiont DhMRE of Dentiscutata heterogama]|uniref:hypothetical protein n=1 Tax=endosymbiont DhMRE of Dentiscutata heterogama TaxID=1609546 RepID=UPI000629D753|nr:hypothetical protein [endosymbiont DhMRE of Dentiscutata heterogama]CFW92979.1 protein of unknown function [endosymbiont DhMRE of Dentiscutata heterogama]